MLLNDIQSSLSGKAKADITFSWPGFDDIESAAN